MAYCSGYVLEPRCEEAVEEDGTYVLLVDLPGAFADRIHVIREQTHYLRVIAYVSLTSGSGMATKSFKIPENYNISAMKSKFIQGKLSLRFPKIVTLDKPTLLGEREEEKTPGDSKKVEMPLVKQLPKAVLEGMSTQDASNNPQQIDGYNLQKPSEEQVTKESAQQKLEKVETPLQNQGLNPLEAPSSVTDRVSPVGSVHEETKVKGEEAKEMVDMDKGRQLRKDGVERERGGGCWFNCCSVNSFR